MKFNPPAAMLLVAGIWIFYGFGYGDLWSRLTLEVDGILVARTPESPSPRINADYIIRGADGRDLRYAAGPTDASLPRDLTVGTRIRKRRWSTAYELNGRDVDDFPTAFYAGMLAVGVSCLWGAFIQWRAAKRRPRANFHLQVPTIAPGASSSHVSSHTSEKTTYVIEPTWAQQARQRDEDRRVPRWPRWGGFAGLVLWLVGIGMALNAGQPRPFREPDIATGHTYEINNHGDVVYVTAGEYWRIYGTMAAGFGLGLSTAVASKLIDRLRR